MKRKHRFLFVAPVLILVLSILIVGQTHITEAGQTDSLNDYTVERAYDYTIENYDIGIVVNENNTMDVTENIKTNFNVEKHGIYRNIPLKNTVSRADGTTTKNRTQITNLTVSDEYTTSVEGKYYKIKIGSADKTRTGLNEYKITYTYNLGKDPLDDIDELYYNIIGTEWDTVIRNVTFSITMPKKFDVEKLGLSMGTYRSFDNENIVYNVNGKTITGNTTREMDVGEALTVRLELPEGYFVGAGLKYQIIDYAPLAIPLGLLILSIIILYVNKRKQKYKMVETVEFYPPDGLNSLDVGYFYKGEANEQDVTSLLIYLANRGYLKIEEKKTKTLASKFRIQTIVKVKEYDGDNENERLFMEGLFEQKNSVTVSSLYDRFYRTTNKILANENNQKDMIVRKGMEKIQKIMTVFSVMSFILIVAVPVVNYDGLDTSLPMILVFVGAAVAVSNHAIGLIHKKGKKNKREIVMLIVWSLLFGGIPAILWLMPALTVSGLYEAGFVLGLFCVFGIMECRRLLNCRNIYGMEMLERINGFKNFLNTAEKDRLEMLVKENPTYFYDILPYAYVLDVSDKWIKQFESINMQDPSWYDSENKVSMTVFMNKTMKSINDNMTMHVNHNSSSGDSGSDTGGGFSGGGSGGGGGSSW